jgi:hypothetical protein
LTSPTRVEAQCIATTNQEAFSQSTDVFVGEVVDTESSGFLGNHVPVVIATFRKETVWKGGSDRQVRVGYEQPLFIGERYLVFATRIRIRSEEEYARLPDWLAPLHKAYDARAQLNGRCHRVESIDKAQATLAWLSRRDWFGRLRNRSAR